jgi:hypothetical protein
VEKEDVFSLLNPSHLLVVVGLGLTVFGLVALLIVGNERRAGSVGRRFRRNLAGVTLSVLFSTMAIVGLATGGIDGRHDHGTGGLASSSAAGGSNVLASPTFAELQGVLRSSGTAAALDRLETLATRDEAILAVAHDYAHAIGKLSLQLGGNPQRAFESCRETFQSGCYHGVIEAHLESNPRLASAEIANLCDGTFAPNTAAVMRFQCLHGLGHGLTANYEHDIFKALRMCDALQSDWDRGSCYGGVFMENIIFAGQLIAAEQGDAHAHEHGAGHKAYLEASDPLYPCNVVDERYKAECFVMQTSPILMFNGYNFPKALAECDRAERNYIHLCYQSIGRDISSYTYRDPQRSGEMCSSGQAAYRGFCFIGVAKNMIDVTWKIDQALELCGAAPADYKGACYNAIGEQLANLYPDLPSRERECARSEPAYVAACGRGAELQG